MIDHVGIRAVLCGVAVLFAAWEMVESRSQLTAPLPGMLCAAQVIAILATLRFPRAASAVLLVFDFCWTAVDDAGVVPTFSGMFLGIGLLSYETGNWIAIGVFAAAAASQALQQLLFLNGDFSSPPYVAVVVPYALCALAGCMVRSGEQAARARLEAERMRQELIRAGLCRAG